MPITGEVHIWNRGILYLRMTAAEMHPCGMGKYSRSVIAGNLFTGPAYNLGLIGHDLLQLHAYIKHLIIAFFRDLLLLYSCVFRF